MAVKRLPAWYRLLGVIALAVIGVAGLRALADGLGSGALWSLVGGAGALLIVGIAVKDAMTGRQWL